MTPYVSRLIRAARNMKLKGDLYSHKRCLRMAREAHNEDRFTTRGDGYTLRFYCSDQRSVIVLCDPRLPGVGRSVVGRDVVVLGYGGVGIAGKSYMSTARRLMMAGALVSMGRGDVVIMDEADSVTDDAWERLNQGGFLSRKIEPCEYRHMRQFMNEPVRQRETASRGDKIRKRKMFGGY